MCGAADEVLTCSVTAVRGWEDEGGRVGGTVPARSVVAEGGRVGGGKVLSCSAANGAVRVFFRGGAPNGVASIPSVISAERFATQASSSAVRSLEDETLEDVGTVGRVGGWGGGKDTVIAASGPWGAWCTGRGAGRTPFCTVSFSRPTGAFFALVMTLLTSFLMSSPGAGVGAVLVCCWEVSPRSFFLAAWEGGEGDREEEEEEEEERTTRCLTSSSSLVPMLPVS
jgi:hypothetical protein